MKRQAETPAGIIQDRLNSLQQHYKYKREPMAILSPDLAAAGKRKKRRERVIFVIMVAAAIIAFIPLMAIYAMWLVLLAGAG